MVRSTVLFAGFLAAASALSLSSAPALAQAKPKAQAKASAQIKASAPAAKKSARPAKLQVLRVQPLRKNTILMRGQRFEGLMTPVMVDYATYGLPQPQPGTRYYQFGERVISVDNETRLILDVIDIASN